MSLNEDPSLWRGQTAGGIPYKLMEGYPTGSFDEDKASIQEKYIIEADRLLDFVEESLSDDSDMIPGGLWAYRKPRLLPGSDKMSTKSISFAPFQPGFPCNPFGGDASPPAGTYTNFLEVTINYESNQNQNDDENNDDEFLNLSCSATGEFMMLPAFNSKWEQSAEGTTAEEVSPGETLPSNQASQPGQSPRTPGNPVPKICPGLEWSVKYPRVKREYLSSVVNTARGLLGKVNNGAVPALMATKAESLLFMGFGFSTKYTWRDKRPMAEIDLKFLEKWIDGKYGHNHFWDPKKQNGLGAWDRIFIGPNKKTVYELADFGPLFRQTKSSQSTVESDQKKDVA